MSFWAALLRPLQFHWMIVFGGEEGGVGAGGPGFGWIPERSRRLTMRARERTETMDLSGAELKLRMSDRENEESGQWRVRDASSLANTSIPAERGRWRFGWRLAHPAHTG